MSLIGLLITLVLGYGTTKLTFATGQDSYLNKDDQVFKDNVEYQSLFGGEAVLVLFTMPNGQTISDLMDPANQTEMDRIAAELSTHPDLITGSGHAEDRAPMDRQPDPETTGRSAGGVTHG